MSDYKQDEVALVGIDMTGKKPEEILAKLGEYSPILDLTRMGPPIYKFTLIGGPVEKPSRVKKKERSE